MAFPFCKTQVPTKTHRIIPLPSGSGTYTAPCWSRDIPDSIPTQTMGEMYLQFQPQAPAPGAAPRPPNLSQRGAPLQRSAPGAYLRGLTAPDGPSHPQPVRGIARPVAAGLLPGWWERVSARREQAGKGDPGIVGTATAFAYYPVLWNFEVVLAMKTGSFGAWFSSFNRS